MRRVLADVSGRLDYSYGHPSRRQSSFGMVLMPSLRRSPPSVSVVVDCAGASAGLLGETLSEIARILHGAVSPDDLSVYAIEAAWEACARCFARAAATPQAGSPHGGCSPTAADASRPQVRVVRDLSGALASGAGRRPRAGIVIVVADGRAAWPEHPPRGVTLVAVLLGDGQAAPPWVRPLCITA